MAPFEWSDSIVDWPVHVVGVFVVVLLALFLLLFFCRSVVVLWFYRSVAVLGFYRSVVVLRFYRFYAVFVVFLLCCGFVVVLLSPLQHWHHTTPLTNHSHQQFLPTTPITTTTQICTQTVNLTGSMTKKNGPDHMTCQQAGKPCCIGIQGECRVVTREECAFVRGYFHHEASLCAQVVMMVVVVVVAMVVGVVVVVMVVVVMMMVVMMVMVAVIDWTGG